MARSFGMAHHDDDLEQRSTPELFALYRSILRQLSDRGVVRTENAPVGDYAEFLVKRALGGTLATNSEKSFDVKVDELRIQVKARVVSDQRKSGQLQLSPLPSENSPVPTATTISQPHRRPVQLAAPNL